MTKRTLASVILGVTLYASAAYADECSLPPKPDVPDGGKATAAEMSAASAAMKKFIAEGEDYLKCLSFKKTTASDNLHDATLDQMTKLAKAFNAEMRTFKERNPN